MRLRQWRRPQPTTCVSIRESQFESWCPLEVDRMRYRMTFCRWNRNPPSEAVFMRSNAPCMAQQGGALRREPTDAGKGVVPIPAFPSVGPQITPIGHPEDPPRIFIAPPY